MRVHIFSIAIMVFLWVKCFPLVSWFSFGFMVFFWVYGIPFSLHCSLEIMLFLYSFRFGYRAICKRRVILCTKRQEVVVVGKSIFHHQHHSACQMNANMGHLEIQEDQRLVLAMGPGNPPAVQVWTRKMGQFGSRPVQKPDPLMPDGPNPDRYPSTRRSPRVRLDPSALISSSVFWVSHLWLHSDMLL